MTTFLWVWLATQAFGVGIVWLFTLGLGGPARRLATTPRVAVVVAVKGHDHEFDEFLTRLFAQDYPAFRVIFAVESASDGAVPAIEKYRSVAPDRVALAIAGQRSDEGQKTTNLRAAVATLTPADEILVLADADIWPEPDWLARLVAPLSAGEADVVSGFAWMVVKDDRLSSYVLSAMGAAVASIPRLPFLNAAWGGCTAMARETFRALDIAEAWRGTLSDDLQLTNVVQQARCRIGVPREILLRTPIKTRGFAEISAGARRWFMLVRIYMPTTYWLALTAMSFSALGWAVAVLGTLTLRRDAVAVLTAAFVLNVLRAFGRARLVRRLWGAEGMAENARYLRLDPLISPLAALLNAVCGWSAAFMRHTTWAGITYEIDGPQQVRVVARAPQVTQG